MANVIFLSVAVTPWHRGKRKKALQDSSEGQVLSLIVCT